VRNSGHLSLATTTRNLNLDVGSSFPLAAIHDLDVASFDDRRNCLVSRVEILCGLVHHLGSAVMGRYSFS
jgi:hypothetical protein